MKASEFFKKITSLYLWANLLAMACVVAVIGIGVKYGLDIYTHHGEAITIPNVKNKSFKDAQAIFENVGLEVVVSDTGYVKSLPPGCVLEQTPEAGERVKSGHLIYLTVNASKTPTITMPDIIDNSSLREAIAKLSSMGFKLGMPKFVSGEKDWVYGVIVNGKNVSAGAKISVEDSVYIQVGNGLRDLSDSVNYIDPIYIDESDLMSGDDFEEVEAPQSSTSEKKEKPTVTEKKESTSDKTTTSTEKKASATDKKPSTTDKKPSTSEKKTETKTDVKSEKKSTSTDTKSSKPKAKQG
ncbi:MAG: PASTA domain-containing protein [Prevotella sp.]|nr:PASTA domain-containing protein [Prevotella sp.]